MSEKTKEFFKAAGKRAIRTVAQTALALIGTATVLADVNWDIVLSASALAGILSILTSIVTGLPEVDEGARYWTGPGGGDHED